jgi:hypothetical protein
MKELNHEQRVAMAIGATAETMGYPLTESALSLMVEDLAVYPEEVLAVALRRVRRAHKGRLTIEVIESQIETGHPSPDEAWASMPFRESDSVVWTDPMRIAFGVVFPLLEEGDKIAARMAFKAAYEREVMKSKELREPAKWTPSLGSDKQSREAALHQAVALNRISDSYAKSLLPPPAPTTEGQFLLNSASVALSLPKAETPADKSAALEYMKKIKELMTKKVA